MNSELVEEDNFEKAEENVEGGGGRGRLFFKRGAVQEEAEIQGFYHSIRESNYKVAGRPFKCY